MRFAKAPAGFIQASLHVYTVCAIRWVAMAEACQPPRRAVRFKFYFAWKFAEGAFAAGGLGFTGYSSSTPSVATWCARGSTGTSSAPLEHQRLHATLWNSSRFPCGPAPLPLHAFRLLAPHAAQTTRDASAPPPRALRRDGASNVRMRYVELPGTGADLATAWNTSTGTWLRRYFYERMCAKGQGFSVRPRLQRAGCADLSPVGGAVAAFVSVCGR